MAGCELDPASLSDAHLSGDSSSSEPHACQVLQSFRMSRGLNACACIANSGCSQCNGVSHQHNETDRWSTFMQLMRRHSAASNAPNAFTGALSACPTHLRCALLWVHPPSSGQVIIVLQAMWHCAAVLMQPAACQVGGCDGCHRTRPTWSSTCTSTALVDRAVTSRRGAGPWEAGAPTRGTARCADSAAPHALLAPLQAQIAKLGAPPQRVAGATHAELANVSTCLLSWQLVHREWLASVGRRAAPSTCLPACNGC